MFHQLWLAWATGSGKDTVIDEVLIPLWYVSIRTSDMLRREIPKIFPKITDASWLSPTKLAQLGKKIRRDYGEDYFTQLAMQEGLYDPLSIVNWLRRKEEFNAIHTAGGWVILVISDTAKSVERVLDIRRRASDMSLSREEIWEHIQQEKKDLDSLKDRADLVLWNEFPTKGKFLEYAKRQITAFIETESERE